MALKVLHILNSLNPSGAEVMLEIANSYWNENDVYSDILATGSTVGVYKKNLEKKGMRIHHIPLNPKFRFLLGFYKFLKTYHYDIIHIHSEGASLFAALAVRLQSRQTIIRTVHHIWPRRRLLPFLKRLVYRFISNKLLKVIPVSNSLSGQENERKYFYANNILIPNWYDDEKFVPVNDDEKKKLRNAYNISNKSIIITSLGGNWPYKNYWMIIEAISHLPVQTKIRYFQIGPEGNNNPLQKLAKKLNVFDKVYFWGKVENVLPYLQMSDYYIMPSTEEGFGNAAIEAMGTGLKPILSDVKALCDFKNYNKKTDIIWIQPAVNDIVNVFKSIENNKEDLLHDTNKFELSKTTKKNFGIKVGATAYLNLYKQHSYGKNK